MTTLKFDAAKMLFEKFLSSIGSISTSSHEVNVIRNKLRRHFNTTTSDYLCSNAFLDALNRIQHAFADSSRSTKYFTLLASFDEELKKHSIKLTRSNPAPLSPTSSSTPASVVTVVQNEPIEEIPQPPCVEPVVEYESSTTAIQETVDYLLDQCAIAPATLHNANPVSTPAISVSRESKQQRKIVKLERRLSRLARMIRDLEEKDMSLEEMGHCDLYVVESNLKKQACEIYAKLAELKSQSPSIDRIIHQPITLNAANPDHPLIDEELEVMVNQSKHFPSFSDVLSTVEKANDKHHLHLDEESRRKLAEKSFKTIGKHIKDRRMADFHDIMSSRLPEDFNVEQSDPALNNADIAQVLLENERDAKIKTEKIFEQFSRIEPDPEAEVNIPTTDAESINDTDDQHASDVVEEPVASPSEPMDTVPPPASEPIPEISLHERQLTILSTAALPVKPPTAVSSPSRHPSEPVAQMLTPRRKPDLTDNEIIYSLYKQRLTNNVTSTPKDVTRKRPVERTPEFSTMKKPKRQVPEVIVLD